MKYIVSVLLLIICFTAYPQNKKISQLPGITSLSSGDLFIIARTVGSTNHSFSKASFDTYVQNLILVDEFATVTIADGAIESVGLGAISSYNGWIINFTVNDGTYTFTGTINPVYSNSLAVVSSPNGTGQMPADYPTFNIEQAIVTAGQYFWKITNNSGSEVKLTYKVESYTAF